jgi:hypothetical protein
VGLSRIDLSHYHPYGITKYAALGRTEANELADEVGIEERMNRAMRLLTSEGFRVEFA